MSYVKKSVRLVMTRAGAGISIFALVAMMSSAAHAQETQPQPASDSDAGLGEIIVTARKVSENLQDVPVAVTAQSGEALQQQSAVRIPDIARLTPGLTIKVAASSSNAVNISQRGQYQGDVLATLDPSVATYVDGYYWARAYGLTADLLDVQSAQVLRGPQGTLFGRNTTGGALLLQTNDPKLNAISGSASVTYGRFNERSGTVVLNLPLIEGKVALRGAVNINKRDGFFNNTFLGTKLGNRDNYTGRVKLLVQPTDNFSILLSAEQFEAKGLSRPYSLLYRPTSSLLNLEAGVEAFGPPASAADVPVRFGQGIGLLDAYIARTFGTDNVELNTDPINSVKTRTFTGTAALDTFFGQIKFIGGYRDIVAIQVSDLEGTRYKLIESPGVQDLSQYSGEMQVTGRAFSNKVDFAFGVFAFHESGSETSRAVALNGLVGILFPGPQTASRTEGFVDTDSMGLYGQATWHVSDALSFTGGLRYSVDDKGLTSFNRTIVEATSATLFCGIVGSDPTTCRIQRRDSYSGISYTAGVNYQINPDTLVYIKTGKGFRSGGQNLRATGAAGAAFIPFKPEVVREHEFGLKTELFDRRLRFNFAAFYNETSDIQRSTIVASIGPTGPTTATIVGNAGKARAYGGEAEATVALFDGFTISGTAALVKAKYVNYIDPFSGYDRSKEPFEQVPTWTASIAANYQSNTSSGVLRLHADYAWQGKTPLNSFDFFTDGAGVIHDVRDGSTIASLAEANTIKNLSTQPAGGTLNARASISFMDDKFEIGVFGRNVLDRRIYNQALFLPAPFSTIAGQRNDPATYGVTVSFKFGQ